MQIIVFTFLIIGLLIILPILKRSLTPCSKAWYWMSMMMVSGFGGIYIVCRPFDWLENNHWAMPIALIFLTILLISVFFVILAAINKYSSSYVETYSQNK